MNKAVGQLQNGYQQAHGQAQSWLQSRILSRYQQLEIREQRILLFAAVILPMAILIFGILLPMQDAQKALQAELVGLQQQAETAEALAIQLAESGSIGKQPEQQAPLLATVERLARHSKARKYMTRIRPQPSVGGTGQRLMLQLKNIPFDASVRFVDALAREHLGLNSMKIQAGTSAGLVHVQAIISRE